MTSGDPKALKRRRDKEDKLSAEGSRLAWMDLDPRLYSNVRENNLTSLVSRDPITNAATICLRARPGTSVSASEGERRSLASCKDAEKLLLTAPR